MNIIMMEVYASLTELAMVSKVLLSVESCTAKSISNVKKII